MESTAKATPHAGDRAILVDVMASLAAAIALLERSPKTAAASDRMFDTMLDDYRASLERARSAFAAGDPARKDVAERLRYLASPDAERLSDFERINRFVSVAGEAADLLDGKVPRGAVVMPEGWAAVPLVPDEAQWGGLARAIVMWWGMGARPTGKALFEHLRRTGEDVPVWLAEEIPDIDHVPPKGTVATCIYRAMVEASVQPVPARESGIAEDTDSPSP